MSAEGNGLSRVEILTIAGDALYRDERVRWVMDGDNHVQRIVLTDGREFVLSCAPASSSPQGGETG